MGDWELGPGGWLHRPWWKVAINTTLRALQRGPKKWLIYTRCSMDGDPPTVLGYGFARVQMITQPGDCVTT